MLEFFKYWESNKKVFCLLVFLMLCRRIYCIRWDRSRGKEQCLASIWTVRNARLVSSCTGWNKQKQTKHNSLMLLPYYSMRKILFRPKLEKPQSFTNRCLASCKGIGIPASGKFLRVESGILGLRIRSTAQGIRNPTNNWNPESKFHWKRSGIQYLESGIHGVESSILDCAWIPLHGGRCPLWRGSTVVKFLPFPIPRYTPFLRSLPV